MDRASRSMPVTARMLGGSISVVPHKGAGGSSTGKPTRFPGRQKPSQFRSVSEACRGLRTEFRPFSRILRLKLPASLCPQNSVSRPTRWRGRSGGRAPPERAWRAWPLRLRPVRPPPQLWAPVRRRPEEGRTNVSREVRGHPDTLRLTGKGSQRQAEATRPARAPDCRSRRPNRSELRPHR